LAQFTLLRGARQLLTLHGPSGARRGSALQNLGVVQDGAVLIKDGIIVEVGSTRRLENLKAARDALDIDLHGSVVMPGFVDAGLKISLRAPRADVPGGKPKKLGQLHDESLELLRSCMHHGTLNAEVKGTASASDFHSDLSVLRRLAKIGDNPVGMIRTWHLAHVPADGSEMADFKDTLARLSRRSLINFIEITLGKEEAVSGELLQAAREACVDLKLNWTGSSSEALRNVLSRVNPRTVFCPSSLSREEVEAFAHSESSAVFSPGHALGRLGELGPRHAVDAGAAIALSSGYDAIEAPGFSMQMAVSLAVIREQLTIEEAISAATVNAAYAVGCGEKAGTLEKGKRADILVLTLSDYREIPRQFGINHVGMVFRDGALVLNRSHWKIGSHEPNAGRVRAQRI
jgi:imidazolonepropionase